ncbi:hypothetical protein QE152_g26532 [Popillia japonica]|uniref:Uncharacterized protein n=1 Tax=Popillia japonica TaxID=7064 RepID=A0AAW1JY36_POPJA
MNGEGEDKVDKEADLKHSNLGQVQTSIRGPLPEANSLRRRRYATSFGKGDSEECMYCCLSIAAEHIITQRVERHQTTIMSRKEQEDRGRQRMVNTYLSMRPCNVLIMKESNRGTSLSHEEGKGWSTPT